MHGLNAGCRINSRKQGISPGLMDSKQVSEIFRVFGLPFLQCRVHGISARWSVDAWNCQAGDKRRFKSTIDLKTLGGLHFGQRWDRGRMYFKSAFCLHDYRAVFIAPYR